MKILQIWLLYLAGADRVVTVKEEISEGAMPALMSEMLEQEEGEV